MNLIVYFSGKVTNLWEQILCVQGSSDGPEQYVLYNLWKYFIIMLYFLYCLVELLLLKVFLPFSRYVAIMNSIFSAQRSMVCSLSF